MPRTAGLIAIIGFMSTVVTAFAEDKSPRPAGPSGDAHQMVSERSEPVRPPASIPSSRDYPRPVVNSQASSKDQHAAEFLKWTEQHASPRR
jgi:hypothetical protein